jgi:Spy/CpxP family protein refolding chaperone
MSIKRTIFKVTLVVGGLALALGVALGGATALAEHAMGPHAMHRHLAKFIEGALDAAKADPAQRKAIEAARERAMGSVKSIGVEHHAAVQQALTLFEADQLDGARVAALKDARLAEMRKAGDAIAAAITEAHDVLRPEQRRAVADYIRANKPSGEPGFRKGQAFMMKRFAGAHIDEMLDEIDANEAQRTAIEAARDHVFSAVESSLAGAEGRFADRALAIFEADRVDPAAVQALRDEHQARAAKIADAVVQAVHDVHDALTSSQRRIVTDTIRERMQRFGRHRGGPFAPTAAPATAN